MISCQNTSVLLALLASTLLLSLVASSSAAAVDDKKYNGICDVDICTCFTYDGTACPDWMNPPTYESSGGYDHSGSFSLGDVTDDDAGQSFACIAYGETFNPASDYSYATEVSSDKTESPMHFLLDGMSLKYWIDRAGGENSTVLVNYTASDPAPDCSTLTPPAKWSSSSDPISTLRMSLVTTSGLAIVTVVATFL